MTSGWTTVFHGSPAEALIVQSKLEAHDIPTLLPNRRVREVDPFIVGPGGLSQAVEVPPEAAELAEELLASPLVAVGDFDDAVDPGEELSPELVEDLSAPRPEPTTDERELERIVRLGYNLRWCALASLIVPVLPALFGLWLGFAYMHAGRRLGLRPAGHVWNLVALGACAGLLIYSFWKFRSFGWL